MNFDQLRQFDAIARLGTVSAAAESLNISQPALSRSIARLEAELGVSLFERIGRRVVLSRVGNAILEYARAILREERFMMKAIDELTDRAATLMVGTVAPAPLWRLTAITVEHFPEQLLTSRMESQSAVERDIINGDIDLGISLKPVQYPSVNCCHLMDEQLSISLSPQHRLAKRKKLSAKDLAGETFLMAQRVGFWADAVRQALPQCEFIIQEDEAMLLHLAANQNALMFASDARYQQHNNSGRVLVPFDHACAFASFYLLARSDASASIREIFNTVSSL
ncbi:LysR family transcriptional regulator [Anaerotardibacter muris]|uniref:LysR family transcriptional regulator n=1 Tax=Anaerotardibacter muris TaxID=2941505 RepID=UPI00203AB797|nr:LysR family transcriptional regulator [Anaerotardibacter muris]